jgi:hypothetical protein
MSHNKTQIFLGYEDEVTKTFWAGGELFYNFTDKLEVPTGSGTSVDAANEFGLKIKGGTPIGEKTSLYLTLRWINKEFRKHTGVLGQINRKYVWGIAPGGEAQYKVNNRWTLHAGAYYAFYPKFDTTTYLNANAGTAKLKPTEYGFTFGLSYKLND